MKDDNLIDLVLKVAEHTSFKNVVWESTASSNEFQTTLAGYIIAIKTALGNEGPEPDYFLTVTDKDGNQIEAISDSELSNLMKRSSKVFEEPAFVIMGGIFNMARRSALGADVAVEKIIKELNGLPPF